MAKKYNVGDKVNYWSVYRSKINGNYVASPYTGKPKATRDDNVYSGKAINNGRFPKKGNIQGYYVELKNLPVKKTVAKKKRSSSRSSSNGFGFPAFRL
jgi:hypothetical protein